ncbi:MAG: fused MFS/spermidine synthase, partial [Planctomycetes bacterium]|nr:fused MFS/spermidine synthase [Planctomycetota bacterium]
AATFFIIPAVGFQRTLIALAAVNPVCAVCVGFGAARAESARQSVQTDMVDLISPLRLSVTVFVTGVLGIGYEVLALRVMGQVLQNTVYTFANGLSVFLLAMAAGAGAYQVFGGVTGYRRVLTYLLEALAIACLMGIVILADSARIYAGVEGALGDGFLASMLAETGLAVCVFVLPALLMGATFSHLAQGARRGRGGVGRALGLNTLGSSLAPLLFGVILLPSIGAKWSICIAAVGYLLLIPEIKLKPLLPIGFFIVIALVLPRDLNLVRAPGGTVLEYREGIMGTVAIVTDPSGGHFLKVNDHFMMGGTASRFAERRQAHIPLLLHPDPRTALFLGMGTGVTFAVAADYPNLDAECVELVPEVVELARRFKMHGLAEDKFDRLTIHTADARRYVRATSKTYDVIIADLFHPARDGAASLYTREHFTAIRDRLAPNGLFCQWLPLYQLNEELFRVIVRTYLEIFPETRAYLAHFNISTPMVALIATQEPITYSAGWLESRVRDVDLRATLETETLTNDFQLFGCLLAGSERLAAYVGPGPINCDDRPIVLFDAPDFVYTPQRRPYERLESLLGATQPSAADVISTDANGDGAAFRDRLDGYLAARDLFFAGMFRWQSGDVQAAYERLLESVRTSPDFSTSYVFVREQAIGLFRSDPVEARRLLEALEEANPNRPDARMILQQRFGLP